MTSLQELLAQKEALEQQIAQLKKAERADALQNARSLIDTFDLTLTSFSASRSPVERQWQSSTATRKRAKLGPAVGALRVGSRARTARILQSEEANEAPRLTAFA